MMMRIFIRNLALASSAAVLASVPAALLARPGYSTNMSRPHSVNSVVADNISARLNDWSHRTGADRLANEYGVALDFAACVARFDPAASDRLLATPLGEIDDRAALVRLAQQNRGCVVESGYVAPILLRVALAEMALRSRGQRMRVPGSTQTRVGLPDQIDGFPLSEVARCQLAYAPAEVARLFASRPGEAAERAAAETLYGAVPQCGLTNGLGGIEPTVARLALVDAAYRPR